MGPKFDDSEEVLIIALDFGTTYSGIAYSFLEGEVRSITDWPG